MTTGLLNRLYPHISTVPPDEVDIGGKGVWKDSRSIEVVSVATAGAIMFFRNDMNDFFLQVGHFLRSSCGEPVICEVSLARTPRLGALPESELGGPRGRIAMRSRPCEGPACSSLSAN